MLLPQPLAAPTLLKWASRGVRPPCLGVLPGGATGLRKKAVKASQALTTAPTTEPFSESVRQRPVNWCYQNPGAAVLEVNGFCAHVPRKTGRTESIQGWH